MGEEEPRGPLELNFKARAITAAVFSISIVVLVLASKATTVIMTSALSGLCAFEFYAMLRSDAKLPNEFMGIAAAALCPIAYAFWHFNGLLSLTVAFACALLIWYVYYTPARITDVSVTLFGACYTGLMLTSLVMIRDILPGFWGGVLVFGVLVSVWGNDTFAFLIGSRFGKHPMAPRISPKKSWEGFVAGMIVSVAVWCLMPLIPGLNLPWIWAVVGGLACGWIGILGDLVESRIKRNTGHKDSGKLLPGHGGFLDRCDSLIVVAAVASLVFRLVGL
ncbi:MAG: phosphatidate cytidylyltransferase [Coriobacteriales bacterium]|jgi:phosphatidate cytidylyltransferase|nr:phosphatidate cytidylyltransferase [Coriobacteriales bacterium]